MDYRESHKNPSKGHSYHEGFSKLPHRRMVWQFEQKILDQITEKFYKNVKIHHLDFACGTGRILRHLSNRTIARVGVDLSPSMLEVARLENRDAEFIEADLTANDVLGDRKFNLVTAFRFFPNAQSELRLSAMQVLTKHLDDQGYLVFNNHKHTGSLRNRLARICGRREFQGMSIAETRDLLSANRLEILKIYNLAVFPASEKRTLLPMPILRPVDAFLSKCCLLGNFGQNHIYVCRRSKAS